MKTLFLAIICLFLLAGCQQQSFDYGVFLGINGDECGKLKNYRTVVIEPSEFSADQIRKLQKDGKVVYGYLNIGSIENYRPYFSRFENITLGTYEDWPDERWVDVSSPSWQDFVINELAREYVKLGLDGFFIDNADVYYNFKNEEIFSELKNIISGLKEFDVPLLINGGDCFVLKCIREGSATSLFDGINQETVFTRIDFENKTYGIQEEAETKYFTEYLPKVKKSGLSVYLLEYGVRPSLSKKIDSFCKRNGYSWYNAKDLDLR